ncbi:hypothetical protein B0T22DRAFT_164447 [Podospora appendiculata]|uniref:Uncharacterized protein n=1 Tax=Podospora appendiculata TaxID=314037 RepID=A0AAE0XAA3_9PEZI|nr:hypothetical protein B0T22DRAFT_164447 [Podospora appendiculata]
MSWTLVLVLSSDGPDSRALDPSADNSACICGGSAARHALEQSVHQFQRRCFSRFGWMASDGRCVTTGARWTAHIKDKIWTRLVVYVLWLVALWQRKQTASKQRHVGSASVSPISVSRLPRTRRDIRQLTGLQSQEYIATVITVLIRPGTQTDSLGAQEHRQR